MRAAIRFAIVISTSIIGSGAEAANSSKSAPAPLPTPDKTDVDHCRAIADTPKQFECFHALNAKLKREVAAAAASQAAAQPTAPNCAAVADPEKRLACYDALYPPPAPKPHPPSDIPQ